MENAKVFDPPQEPPPIIVSGFGTKAVELAARIGDGYWGHSPEKELLETFSANGGSGPRYAQMNVCWGPDEAEARKTAHHFWPNGGLSGQMMQDLPTWTHFDEATSLVTEDDAVSSIPCGPDIGPIVESVKKFLDAGYDHLYFHQVGPDQDGFLDIWTKELQPALADLR